jgi:hypothetical protein
MLTPIQPLHLSGLLHSTAQLVVSMGHGADPAPQSLAPPCTFGGKQVQTAPAPTREFAK